MPYLDDYGGHTYGTRYRVKRCAQNMRSYVCNGCKKRFYLSHVVANRNVPRCPCCGSSGEETEPSIKRRLGCTKKQVAKKLHAAVGSECYKINECRFCHVRFRTTVAMKLHMEEKHNFKEEF